MNILESQLSKNGFIYNLIQRETLQDNKSVAIYSQHTKDQPTTEVIAYEVFIIPLRKKDVMTPTKILLPAGEVYPGNEYFGSFAKSIYASNDPQQALNRAQQYFEQFKTHIVNGS